MKKIVTTLTLLLSANIYANKVSICDGRFESGQPVHVQIDWDNKTVKINKFTTFIQSAAQYGVVTGNYQNSLGMETFSIIGHFPNKGTFITQQQIQYGQITTTNFARLSCSKSFYKPFTNKMLET